MLQKKKKHLFSNIVGFTLWLVIPLLFLLWRVVGLGNYVSETSGLLTIQLSHKARFDQRVVNSQIIKGIKLRGKLESFQNGLGTVLLRFYNFDRINSDELKFRIREEGDKNWYYESQVNVDQFLPDEYFTFGFPVIENSKGKIYEFEIESVRGTPGDAVAISRFLPQIASRYQFKKDEIKGNFGLIGYIVAVKFLNMLVDNQFLKKLLVSGVSLGLYYMVLLDFSKLVFLGGYVETLRRIMIKSRFWFILAVSCLTLVDILLVKESNDWLFAGLSIFWLFSVLVFQLHKEFLFYLAILTSLLYPVAFVFGQDRIADKLAIWWYLFIVMGLSFYVWIPLKQGRTRLRTVFSKYLR